MSDKRVTNFLLLVIAICLALMVFRLYDIDVVRKAEAEQRLSSSVAIMGWYPGGIEGEGGWKNVVVDAAGRLVVSK